MKHNNTYYTNLQLEDLPNEIWVDAIGYDGIYSVSNLGRIKSCCRYVNTRWGTPRLIKEKILKQTIKKASNGRLDGLIVTFDKAKNSAPIIFKSFYPDINFEENECVMHINKNILDNRIENLQKSTRVFSKGVDMVKSVRTILATPINLKKAIENNKAFYDKRTHKECSKCGKIDILINFYHNKSICNNCINSYVVKRRKDYKYKAVKKSCNQCGKYKKDIHFPKLNNTCKKCKAENMKNYMDEQRKNLTDVYIKIYGKTRYGLKVFNDEIIEKLRNEILEKRKPKHFFDNKEFYTTRDFAKYIYIKYKVPVTTVEDRINNGRTEYECTLNRLDFVRYNLKNKNN